MKMTCRGTGKIVLLLIGTILMAACFFGPRPEYGGPTLSSSQIKENVRAAVASDIQNRHGNASPARLRSLSLRNFDRNEIRVSGIVRYEIRNRRIQSGFDCLVNRFDGRIRSLRYY